MNDRESPNVFSSIKPLSAQTTKAVQRYL